MSRSLTCGWEYRLNSSSSNGSLTADGTLADIEGGRAKMARLVRQTKKAWALVTTIAVHKRAAHCPLWLGRRIRTQSPASSQVTQPNPFSGTVHGRTSSDSRNASEFLGSLP